jgi:hypothetical protein
MGRLTGALGQFAHLVGDDGEAAAAFAGARRLDRCIERQQVGLLGDLVDDIDDFRNPRRVLIELVDGVRRLADLAGDRRNLLDRSADRVAAAQRCVTGLLDHLA